MEQGTSTPVDKAVLAQRRRKYSGELKKLAALARERRLTIFIGAGLNQQLGMPGWSGFLRQAAQDDGTRAQIEALINTGDFIQAADVLERNLGADGLAAAIKHAFDDHKIAGRCVAKPFTLLTQFFKAPIVTTNFDRVLETVFTAAGKTFKGIYVGAAMEQATNALVANEHVLLKIHGTWDDTERRVLTSAEYKRSYGGTTLEELKITESLAFLVLELLLMRHILFLACSLTSDLTMSVARLVKEKTGVAMHYAFVPDPKPEEKTLEQRKEELSAAGIQPIFFPADSYEFISELLQIIQPPIGLAPATQVAFNVLGFFAFSLSLYLAIYYQRVMTNNVGPLLLLIGLVALPLCLWLILALAFRHARTSYNTTLSDRLVPVSGFKASDGWNRVRWAGWFLYIAFPVTITVHFWLEARKLILHQDNAPDVGLVERNMSFPDYFFQGRWDLIFGAAPHYWWGTGPNHVQAYPIIQPWLNSILAASVLILAFTYTFCVLTGVGVTKIRKKLKLETTSLPPELFKNSEPEDLNAPRN